MREGLGTRLAPDNPDDKNEKRGAFGYIVHELIDDVPKAMKVILKKYTIIRYV